MIFFSSFRVKSCYIFGDKNCHEFRSIQY